MSTRATRRSATPRTAHSDLWWWLRGAGTRRMFARALGGSDKPNDTYLRMATTVLDKVATEIEQKPWAGATVAEAAPGLRVAATTGSASDERRPPAGAVVTNEAAERLRSYVGNHPAANKLVDAALAAERKATVERIRRELRWIDMALKSGRVAREYRMSNGRMRQVRPALESSGGTVLYQATANAGDDDAALIVRAVNAHDALVVALRLMVEAASFGWGKPPSRAVLEQAHAVLRDLDAEAAK